MALQTYIHRAPAQLDHNLLGQFDVKHNRVLNFLFHFRRNKFSIASGHHTVDLAEHQSQFTAACTQKIASAHKVCCRHRHYVIVRNASAKLENGRHKETVHLTLVNTVTDTFQQENINSLISIDSAKMRRRRKKNTKILTLPHRMSGTMCWRRNFSPQKYCRRLPPTPSQFH